MARETAEGRPFADLAAEYWNHHAATHEAKSREDRAATHELLWAWDEVEQIIDAADARSIELLITLADTAPDDHAHAYLGAGPLETLLAWHWQVTLDPLEVAIRQNPRLRRALDNVWWSEVPPAVMDRLAKFGLRDLRDRTASDRT